MSNQLVSLDQIAPLVLFESPDKADQIVNKFKEEVMSVEADISTNSGRETIRSIAHRIAKSKNAIDKAGKDLTEEWMLKKKAVDAERRRIWDIMEAIQADFRKPLTDWENAEKERVAAREGRLVNMSEQSILDAVEPCVADYDERIRALKALYQYDWQEFIQRADQVYNKGLDSLNSQRDARIKRDEERAELERLRAQQAENERTAREKAVAEQAKAEAERKAAAEAAAVKAKADAEKAAIEARAEAERKAKEDAERRAKQAEVDKAAAEKRAAEAAEAATIAERKRKEAEDEAKAEAERKRQADVEHKRSINGAILAALVTSCGITDEQAKSVVSAMAKGDIPHVVVRY